MISVKKSFLYRNLRTKTWSRKEANGRVSERPLQAIIYNPKMVVSTAGRDRVRRTKIKVVHAGIRGHVTFTSTDETWDLFTMEHLKTLGFREITYNPYLYDSFVFSDTGEPIFMATIAYMTADMKVYVL